MNYVLRFDGCYFTNPDIAHKGLQVLLSRGLSTSVSNSNLKQKEVHYASIPSARLLCSVMTIISAVR